MANLTLKSMDEIESQAEMRTVEYNNYESLINYIKLEDSRGDELSEKVEEEDLVIEEEDLSSTSSDSSGHESTGMFETVREASGAWGTHRFEKYPWSDYSRPCVKLEEYDDLSLDDDEESGLLTDSIISSGLSYLEKSPYDLKFVLCKCILSRKTLIDISALTYYHYIQYLDLSWNNITNLAPLGQLPFLQYLNASHNDIMYLLDFKAPFYLSFVDFSYNLIDTIPDLTEFWSITNLNISNNKITRITGLENLRYLNGLNLSYNKITTLENLSHLRIQFLILHHNDIIYTECDTMNFKTLCYLRSVDLSNNKISSLKLFENTENLESINMSMNKIASLLEFYYLQNLRYLSKLNVSGNPVCEEKFYANVCLRTIPNLMVLDGKEISAEERFEIRGNCEIDPKLKAGKSHIELILLQQINHPAIGAHILPYDQPPPAIIVLVGTPGSRKQSLLNEICEKIQKCVVGVSHTTRSRTDVEVNGEDYYFVNSEEFKDLVRQGRFIAVTEFNGHSYGITHEEIQKCQDGILIFHSDLNTALTLRLMSLNPKLVLALPRTETAHLNFLKDKYTYSDVGQGVYRIRNSPAYIRVFDPVSSVDSITKLNRSIVDEVVQKALDIKDHEKVLQDNTIYTRDFGHTVTPVLLSDEECDEDIDNPGLCSILKRGPCTKEIPRVSFFKSPTRESALSAKLGSVQSSQSNLSVSELSPNEPTSELTDDTNDTRDSVQSTIDSDYRSISGKLVPDSQEYNEEYFLPFLSALSTLNVKSREAETIYIKPAEIYHLIRDEKLATFFKNILESRRLLLDIHWSNPGLFREVIFTDEREASVDKIKALVKSTIENYKSMRPKISVTDDPSYQPIVKSRFDQLDFQQSPQCDLEWTQAQCPCEHPKRSH